MTLYLNLEAKTDLSLSTGNQTLGQADSHDYIPGRTLWGAIAAAAYGSGMAEDLAFRLFQLGDVRVTDGVPMLDGARCYPSPSSWHHPKEQPGGECRNFAIKAMRDVGNEQYKPRSVGWLTADLQPLVVDRDYSLRTAVDSTGKAREGLLYGLPVIRAGTRFLARLEGAEADLKEVRRFVDGRDLRLGRSRNAELGLVKVAIASAPKSLSHGIGKVKQVSFLCVSRCVFRDAKTGAPTLVPSATEFGLAEDWSFDLAASFVRSTRVVHFHGKRGRPEPERYAVEKGSVLTFTGPSSVMLEDLASSLRGGVGDFTAQGYGDVLVAPKWLTLETVQVQATGEKQAASAPPPKDELFRWATERGRETRICIDLYGQATDDASSLRAYKLPGSQWGAVRAMARAGRYQDAGRLREKLNDYVHGGKRQISKGWKRAYPDLEKLCQGKGEHLAVYLEFLASACMRTSVDENRGERR